MFEDDGCTFWFDHWRGIDLTGCCAVHDDAFANGRSICGWFSANVDLLTCGISLGAWDWALLAFLGVMSPIGALLYFAGKKRHEPDTSH